MSILDFSGAKDDGSGDDKAPVKLSPPTNQHPIFYGSDALPVTQPTVSEYWRKKYHIPWTCSPQSPIMSLITKVSWLSLGRVPSLTLSD